MLAVGSASAGAYRMPRTKLWFVICTCQRPGAAASAMGIATHVAIAITASPIKDARSTRQPNCSRMGIRILTMSPVPGPGADVGFERSRRLVEGYAGGEAAGARRQRGARGCRLPMPQRAASTAAPSRGRGGGRGGGPRSVLRGKQARSSGEERSRATHEGRGAASPMGSAISARAAAEKQAELGRRACSLLVQTHHVPEEMSADAPGERRVGHASKGSAGEQQRGAVDRRGVRRLCTKRTIAAAACLRPPQRLPRGLRDRPREITQQRQRHSG
jgi:hypothetical protein